LLEKRFEAKQHGLQSVLMATLYLDVAKKDLAESATIRKLKITALIKVRNVQRVLKGVDCTLRRALTGQYTPEERETRS